MPQKILVVDDKPFMLRLIQHHLQKAGYELIHARTREEAIKAVAHETPDVVVVDKSGVQAGDFDVPGTTVPVIRMTDDPQSVEGNANNGELVVSKPFSPSKLIAQIKRLAHDGGAEQ